MDEPIDAEANYDPRLCLGGCRRIAAFEGHLPCWSTECQLPIDAQVAEMASGAKTWLMVVGGSEESQSSPDNSDDPENL